MSEQEGAHRPKRPDTAVVDWGVTVGDSLQSVRELRLLRDQFGRTWVAVFPPEDQQSGGVMAHLLPNESVEVVDADEDGVTLRVPPHGQRESEVRVPAYLVVGPLLPPSWTS